MNENRTRPIPLLLNLGDNGLLVRKITIANLACFSWVTWSEWAGLDVNQFKLVKEWVDKINARPALKRGLDVPEPFEIGKKMRTKVGKSPTLQ